jgi:ankyrin repeat protein
VPTVPLPDRPSLEQLRNQAKDLQRAVRASNPEALAEVAERYPSGFPDDSEARFALSAAQLVVARRHGLRSWTRLKQLVEVVQQYSRFPNELVDAATRPADEFLRLACLSYEDDQPERWTQAAELLAAHPRIGQDDVYVAAATADVHSLGRILGADPGASRREGGPYRWQPLLYLAYARHDLTVSENYVLGAARLLLQAGADPNAGYLWHGLVSPFTVLTGVFGEGELGPERQRRHPHDLALARLLLQAGADPNDSQTLYNRMFGADNGHLELLFEFGLGAGDGGPWKARLGEALQTPAQMLRTQLQWAIIHGMADRVALLVEHGVDVASPFDDGSTTAELAATSGNAELVDYLVAHGSPALDLAPAPAFIAAALAADRASLDQLRADHPGLVETVRSAHPALVVWAAASGRPGAVELLVEAGFDVNARGRTDVPIEQPWETALHHAARRGDVELARILLALGADPDIHDARFDATPLQWAGYFEQSRMVELLEPRTTQN